MLETVPGLIVTQHSGDGKANQYFIRGFNLDHGTDFQTRIEGMPVPPARGAGQRDNGRSLSSGEPRQIRASIGLGL